MAAERQRAGNVVPLRPASPEPAATDAELVAAVRAGDRGSVLELYRRYAGHAERMIVRICGIGPERADLLHDVFVRAMEGIETLRDPGAVRPWICGIAIRRAREHLRVRRRVMPAPAADGRTDPATGPRQEGSLELRRVEAILEQIDPDDRVAFVLRRIEGMDLAEIAAACGVSLATIKRRIARAEELFTELARRDAFLSARLEGRER